MPALEDLRSATMSSSVLVPQASFGLGPVFSPPASPGAMVVDANNNGDSSSSSSSDDCSPVRPDLSYAHLAALAIDASGQKRCTVGEIYAWIEARYPYFKSGCPWWKVSLFVFLFSLPASFFGICIAAGVSPLPNTTMIRSSSV